MNLDQNLILYIDNILYHDLNALKYWNEDIQENAIYSIYIKKVRYNPAGRLNQIIANEPLYPNINVGKNSNTSLLHWETVKVKHIKAGTIDKLIDELIDEKGNLNHNYTTIFLATFRAFIKPLALMNNIQQRLTYVIRDKNPKNDDLKNENVLKSFKLILLTWLDFYPEDFYDSPQYNTLNLAIYIAKKCIKDRELGQKALHMLEKFKFENNTNQNILPLFAFINDINIIKNNLILESNFDSFDEILIAEQLTFMDAHLFKKLIPYECMGCFWSKKDKIKIDLKYSLDYKDMDVVVEDRISEIKCLSVMATVDFFNIVTFKVMDTILDHYCYLDQYFFKIYFVLKDKKKYNKTEYERIKHLIKWIDISKELRMLKNFSSMKAVVSALRSNPIYRLQNIWNSIPKYMHEYRFIHRRN
ncbi:unnamed protein product [Gordionus sp. m RMFG-2023]